MGPSNGMPGLVLVALLGAALGAPALACAPRLPESYNPAPTAEEDPSSAEVGEAEAEGISGVPCPDTAREGAPCGLADSWCVVDWGEPCGHSTALWCVDGKWQLEHEANLCDDERAGI